MSDTMLSIGQRAVREAARYGQDWPLCGVLAIIKAYHEDKIPLDLEGLLQAEAHDFMHDVCGILHDKRLFLPRYAAR